MFEADDGKVTRVTYQELYQRVCKLANALKSLGVAGVASVRQGKVFDIELADADVAKAEAALKEAAEKLLANTVIEKYEIEIK